MVETNPYQTFLPSEWICSRTPRLTQVWCEWQSIWRISWVKLRLLGIKRGLSYFKKHWRMSR